MELNYKNYIFDFGQVIVKFEPEYLSVKYIPDLKDRELCKKVIFDRLYWDKLDEGITTDDEVKREMCARLPERLHESAVKVYDNWHKNLEFINGMPELIRKIKENGGKLYLLSNISNKFAEGYSSVPHLNDLFSLFDGLLFSAPTKVLKPDKRFFRILFDRYDIDTQKSIFIDDNENNILAAKELGLNTYLFDGNADELEKYL